MHISTTLGHCRLFKIIIIEAKHKRVTYIFLKKNMQSLIIDGPCFYICIILLSRVKPNLATSDSFTESLRKLVGMSGAAT